MKAIEFTAIAKQGKTIEIPNEYIDEISGEFRVILLLNSQNKVMKSSKKRSLNAVQIDTKDLMFNRDEANER